jgi:hypothetical protein
MLPDDIILEIFDFYRKSHDYLIRAVWKWPILVHVCQRWRQIVLASPHRLNLRILCTHGTPVRNLGIWPAFPIVMDYYYYSKGGLMFNDEDDVVAVLLGHLDRICDVRLSVMGSQLENIATAMQVPFPVLSRLHIFSRDGNVPVLPAEFLGGSGPRLQDITLSGIPYPSLPTLLLSATDLVTLSLRNIPSTGYISPEAMVACLAMLTRLKAFHIEFQSATPRPSLTQPPVARAVLPALIELEFKGASEYLEGLAIRIDGPQLNRIHTVYFNQVIDFQVAQLSDFIDRALGPRLTLFRHAEVTFVRDFVSFDLYPQMYQPSSNWGLLRTVISCDGFDWQVSHMAHVLSQFSAILSNVVLLQLRAEVEEGRELEGTDGVEWLHLLHQFSTVRTLRVSGELAGHVALALEELTTAEMVAELLPFLDSICLAGQRASSIKNFVAFRQLCGRPITVSNPEIDHEALVHDLRAGLVPHIAATRIEPLDYDLLTDQLSQAVKPHISQLISLASDKRETAAFLVDKLIPVFQNIFPSAGSNIDVPAVVAQIVAEIRRVVAPLDPHEMKEQVSRLVVERLHSRLATRDHVLDTLQNKLPQFDTVLEPVNEVSQRVAELSKGQEALFMQTRDLVAATHNTTDILSTIPELLASATEPLRTMLADLISAPGVGLSSPDFLRFSSSVESLSIGQQALQRNTSEFLTMHQDFPSRLVGHPNSAVTSTEAAQFADAELLAHSIKKEDFEEVRGMVATNSGLQVQLAKAHAQYGATRAEKDIMLQRIASTESELDQLRAKVNQVQAVMLLRAPDAATSQALPIEPPPALSHSSAQLKTLDESQQGRSLELEQLKLLNQELNADNLALVSKASTFP